MSSCCSRAWTELEEENVSGEVFRSHHDSRATQPALPRGVRCKRQLLSWRVHRADRLAARVLCVSTALGGPIGWQSCVWLAFREQSASRTAGSCLEGREIQPISAGLYLSGRRDTQVSYSGVGLSTYGINKRLNYVKWTVISNSFYSTRGFDRVIAIRATIES